MEHKDDMGQAIAREIGATIARKIAIGIAFFIAALLFVALGGVVVQMLWNWLVPDLFALRRITVWEALGLLLLCRILFGGFGRGRGPSHSGWRRRGHRKEWWKPADLPRERDGV